VEARVGLVRPGEKNLLYGWEIRPVSVGQTACNQISLPTELSRLPAARLCHNQVREPFLVFLTV
jgi:hypothetical protein